MNKVEESLLVAKKERGLKYNALIYFVIEATMYDESKPHSKLFYFVIRRKTKVSTKLLM